MKMSLINRIFVVAMSFFIAACSQSTMVQAKQSGPVIIGYDIAKDLVVGELVTTTVDFTAKMYLQQLVVSVAADRGLTLESGAAQQVFTNIEVGAMREVEISIILTDSKGYVSVTVETTDTNGRISNKNKVIKFTSDDADAGQLKAIDKSVNEKFDGNADRSLILMPAEAEH
jgi:hypothetical protein